MKHRNLILFTSMIALAAALPLQAQTEAADADAGHDPVEKYSGFAEDNPDVVGDRGNGLPPETEAAGEAGTAEAERYPDEVAEGNPSLRPGAPETERPYAEEADVHGGFGEGNPDVQR
ncbi:MAG: hypothetical protein K9M02_03890 [Thiohalocapsa sp.]|nr:hypothetical protein [Thiohalocapsa sp.]